MQSHEADSHQPDPHDTRKRIYAIVSSASGILLNGMIFTFMHSLQFILLHCFFHQTAIQPKSY